MDEFWRVINEMILYMRNIDNDFLIKECNKFDELLPQDMNV